MVRQVVHIDTTCYLQIKKKCDVINFFFLNLIPKEDAAKQVVRDAIAAGIFNDLGSGSNIDLCVITKNKVNYIRPHDEANKKGVR